MDLQLRGKSALVLGASRGLGHAIARGLYDEGCKVTIVSRSGDTLAAAAAGMPGCATLAADLTTPAGADAVAALAGAEPFDILVNNTGGPPPSTAVGTPLAAWQTTFQALFLSLTQISLAALTGMQARGFGRILTVASAGVAEPIPGLVQSNAARSAFAAWSKTLAREVAGDGVTVNILAPGRIATKRMENLDRMAAEAANQPIAQITAASTAQIPAGRYGAPEEFAALAVFLASPLAGYVTGELIRVDGGLARAL